MSSRVIDRSDLVMTAVELSHNRPLCCPRIGAVAVGADQAVEAQIAQGVAADGAVFNVFHPAHYIS